MTLKLGVIGAGGIFWQNHRKNLAEITGIEIAALCDISEESRNRAVEEFGCRTYSEISDMVAAESGLDALLNFSPPVARKQAIEAAIQLNIPIFVEKPVAGTVKQAEEILGLLKASPVPVSVGFMFRYMPAVDQFMKLLEGKQVIHVNSEFFCPAITQWNLPGWFLKKEISGGPVVDQAIHLFDLIRYLTGEVDAATSFQANVIKAKDEDCTIEESSSTILKFANGSTGSHIHSWVHDVYGGSITVRTEHDKITIDLVDGSLSGEVGGEALKFESPGENTGRQDHLREMEVFLDAVRTGDFSKVRSDYADAAQSLAVADAVNCAMDSETIVKIKEVR